MHVVSLCLPTVKGRADVADVNPSSTVKAHPSQHLSNLVHSPQRAQAERASRYESTTVICVPAPQRTQDRLMLGLVDAHTLPGNTIRW